MQVAAINTKIKLIAIFEMGAKCVFEFGDVVKASSTVRSQKIRFRMVTHAEYRVVSLSHCFTIRTVLQRITCAKQQRRGSSGEAGAAVHVSQTHLFMGSRANGRYARDLKY